MIIEIKYSKNLEKYSDILKDILKKFKLTNKGIYRQYITTFLMMMVLLKIKIIMKLMKILLV